MTIKRLFALCAIGILMIAGSVSAQEDETLNIVATTTQAVDIANILTDGVETVNITALMGAGVDPHLYQPTEADISAMNDADIVIYNGLNLEGQFDTVFQALSEQGTSIFALGNPVKDAGFIVGGFELSDELQDVDDPHFWFAIKRGCPCRFWNQIQHGLDESALASPIGTDNCHENAFWDR